MEEDGVEEAPFATAERAVATMDVQPAVMSGKRTQADEWAERQRQAEKGGCQDRRA